MIYPEKVKIRKRIRIAVIAFLLVTLLVSGYLSGIRAETLSTITQNSDTEFNTGTFTDTEVSGSGTSAKVQLAGGALDWADPSWQYRRPLTITSTNTSPLTEYQVFVRLTTSNFDYSNVESDCSDIRFGSDSGNFIPHYQLSCNTSGTSEFWVQVDSIPASGTTDIYVYYGNSGASTNSSEVATFSYTSEKPVGYILHDGINNLKVKSLEDGNSITHNGSTLNLNDGGTGNFSSVNRSTPISAKKLFNAHDDTDNTDAFVPVSFAGTEILATSRDSSSGSEEFFLLSPWGTASVTIRNNGTTCYTGSIGSTTVSTGSSCYGSDGSTYRITSSIPILAFMDENTTDPYPLHASDTGPWYGISGTRFTISANASGASTTWYRSDNVSQQNTAIAADRDYTLNTSTSYGAGPAIKVSSNNPVTANQWADGNGGDGAFFLPYHALGTKYGAFTTADYVSIASAGPAQCSIYNNTGGLVASGTAASSNSQVYYLGFGTGSSNTYISTGWTLECDRPVYAYYEKAADSESNVWTYAQMRQFAYPTPTVGNPGTESGALAPTGTWASAIDSSNVIDLVWNGDWGDGTGGSTAFSATIADVSASASIAFQVRVGQDLSGLATASYYTLGLASSGTTFTATKTDFDTLGIPTGDYRYMQVRTTHTSSNGIDNPKLDSFGISYMADDTGPTTNASSIEMYTNTTGAQLNQNDWTNDDEPYFTWTAGSDTQAGILGYCLYVGTDSNGDPTTTKGLLGTSPVSAPGDPCPFIIASNSIDFATTSYQGGTWLSSDTVPYYINVLAVDEAGNTFSGIPASFYFRFDNTEPDNPAYFSLPGGFISDKDVTLTWPTSGGNAASDDHSGLAGLQYRIGNLGTWYGDSHTGTEDLADLLVNDGSYQTDPTYDYTAIIEGSNFLYMRAWDNAGNSTLAAITGVLQINSTAPSPPANLAVTPSDNTTNAYSFSWTAPGTFTGQAANITYCYTVNTLPSASTCTFTTAGVTSIGPDAFATQPGTNTFYVVARDEAFNINYATYTQIGFTYSGTAPGIPINLDIADISVKATSNWRLAVSWEEPVDVGAGVTSYKLYRSTVNTTCVANIAAFTEISTLNSTAYADNLPTQQDYYYCTRACDSANNCSAVSATVSDYPDGKFTEPAELIGGPTVTELTTKRAKIEWTTARTSDSKVAFGLATNDYFEEEPSKSNPVTSHEISLVNLEPGTTYYFRAKWTDEDGNTGVSSEKAFTTNPAPLVKNVSVLRTGLDNATIQFTAKGAYGTKVYYGTSTSFGGLNEISTGPTESTYTVNITGLQDGTKYFFKVNPVDEENSEYEGTVLDFSTLPRPTISNVDVEEVKEVAQPTVRIIWETNTNMTSVLTFYSEHSPELEQVQADIELIDGEHEMLISGLTPETKYFLIVSGADGYGNGADSDVIVFTTATDSRPPKVLNLRAEGSISEFSGEAFDERTAQIFVTWDTDEPSTSQVEYGPGITGSYFSKTPEDMNLTTNHLIVIPNLDPSQVYHLRVITEDSAGNQTISKDLTMVTPKIPDSALELVIGNLISIFGFLQ